MAAPKLHHQRVEPSASAFASGTPVLKNRWSPGNPKATQTLRAGLLTQAYFWELLFPMPCALRGLSTNQGFVVSKLSNEWGTPGTDWQLVQEPGRIFPPLPVAAPVPGPFPAPVSRCTFPGEFPATSANLCSSSGIIPSFPAPCPTHYSSLSAARLAFRTSQQRSLLPPRLRTARSRMGGHF